MRLAILHIKMFACWLSFGMSMNLLHPRAENRHSNAGLVKHWLNVICSVEAWGKNLKDWPRWTLVCSSTGCSSLEWRLGSDPPWKREKSMILFVSFYFLLCESPDPSVNVVYESSGKPEIHGGILLRSAVVQAATQLWGWFWASTWITLNVNRLVNNTHREVQSARNESLAEH
jgi:hypothetical protein